MTSLRDDPYPDVHIGGGFSDPATATFDEPATATFDEPESGSATESGLAPGPYPEPCPQGIGGGAGRGRRAAQGVLRLFRERSRRCGGRHDWIAGGVATLAGVLSVFPSLVPNSGGNLGSLLETLLPWTGLTVPVLLAVAALRRSTITAVAAVALGVTWAAVFGPLFVGGSVDVRPNLTVVTHNVGAANPDPASTARTLLAAGPDLVALEEVTDDALPAYRKALDGRLPHSVHIGTVALWSRYPITESQRLTIDPGWSRSLRATVRGPQGPLAVYVVHLPSVRVGPSGFAIGRRDQALAALDLALGRERQKKVVLLGDLNGSTADRTFAPLTSRLKSVADEAGTGLGLSWPAAFPIARVDHILTRGVVPTDAWTLPATGSDHRPVAAKLKA